MANGNRLSFAINQSADALDMKAILPVRTANRIPRDAREKSNILKEIYQLYQTSDAFYSLEHIANGIGNLNNLQLEQIPNATTISENEKLILIKKCEYLLMNFEFLHTSSVKMTQTMIRVGAYAWKVDQIMDIALPRICQK